MACVTTELAEQVDLLLGLDALGDRSQADRVGQADDTSTLTSRTPAPNGNGWNKTDVLITIKATDAGSGLKSINANYSNMDVEVPVSGASDQAIFQVSREDANSFSYWSVDNAGNVETRQTTATVKIDKTVPVTTAAVTSTGTLVNGYYNKTASVALSATDVSPNFGAVASGIASMQYQLGGTSGTWLNYTTAIPVNDGTTTVYFRSTDLADNTEDPKSVTVKVDSAAPTTTITRTGDDTTWNKNDVAVTLNATDAVSGVKEIHYTVTGGTEQVVTGATASFTVSREDANSLVFWAIDKAANEETPHKTATVKLDKTAPATTSSTSSNLPGNNGWSRQAPVTVTLTPADTSPTSGAVASGVASTQYLVTTTNTVPTDWSGATTGTSLGVSTEGTRYVWFRSMDVAGNTEAGKVQQVLLDTAAPTLGTPTVTGTAGSNGWYVGATAPVVKFTASDNTSGVATLEYRIGATGTWTTYNATSGITVPESTNANGSDLYFRATDVAGNLTTSAAYYVKYDKTAPSAPTLTVTPGAPDGTSPWYVNSPTVTGSSSDSASGIDHYEYQLNSTTGSWTTSAFGFSVPDGSAQTVNVRTVDAAGNISSSVASGSLKVDTVKPAVAASVTAGTLGNNDYYRSNPTITFTGSDNGSGLASLAYSTNGTTFTDTTNGGTLTLSVQGTTTVTVKGTDVAGNVQTATLVVKVDTVAPSAPGYSVSPASPNGTNSWYTTRPQVTLSTGTDATSGYAGSQYQYNGIGAAGWLSYVSQILVPDTTSTGTTLYYRGLDNAGNVSGNSFQTFKVDTVLPSTTATPSGTAGSNGYYRSNVGVTLGASDTTPGSGVLNTQYQVTTSSTAPTSWTGATTGTSPNVTAQGTSYVWYRSTDNAGNTEAAKFLQVLIDSVSPTASITAPSGGGSYETGNSGAGSWAKVCGDGSVCAMVSDSSSTVDPAGVTFLLTSSSGNNSGKCWTGTAWTTGSGCAAPMTVTNGTAKSAVIPRANMDAGNYSVTVTAKDMAGNSVTTPAVSFSTK